ncbi:MAG: YwaF family protein [Oscillospiraceae bacterium]|nr:YwaF family protein [Oscillospiraceae bacterium]
MFWLHEEDLPPGVGSEPFCAAHLAYLVVFLALTVAYALFYKKQDEARRKKADRAVGAAVFLFGLFEYGVTALIGRFSLYTLPIHICSLMLFLIPLHAGTGGARPGSFAARLHRFLGAVVFHPGILGAWAALLFPDWLRAYPFWNYLSVAGFMEHGLISLYGASILVKDAEAPEPKRLLLCDLRDSSLFLLVGAALMYRFDRAVGADYWFLAGPSVGSPFEAVFASGGYRTYLLALALSAALVTALWYALRYFLFVRKRPE